MPTTARGDDIYVTNFGTTNTIGEYTTSGSTVNASLITSTDPYGMAASGTNLFVTNLSPNTVGEYTATGASVNPTLISGISESFGIAVSGSDVFVTNYGPVGTIGEYTLGTTPGTITSSTPSLVSGLNGPEGIAVSGSDLFVANYNDGTIAEYTTSGSVVNPALITGLSRPYGIAISGSNLSVRLNSSTSAVRSCPRIGPSTHRVH